MPAETQRKVIKLGGAHVVALPADFCKYYKIGPKTQVRILYDSLILIVPDDCEAKVKEKEELIRRLLE